MEYSVIRKSSVLIPSLRTLGDIGLDAIMLIEHLKKEVSANAKKNSVLEQERDKAERAVREQELQIQRLKKRIVELESRGL